MIPRHRLVFLWLLAANAGVPAAVAGDAEDGRMLASQCAQCHGTDGTGMETLAGKSYWELLDEMVEMKRSTKPEVMHLQARGYSDAQIRLIADYFSKLPRPAGGD